MKQITIVAKEYDGLTADIAAVLGDNDINIENLDAEAADGMGVVTLTVDHYNRALHALRDARRAPDWDLLLNLDADPAAPEPGPTVGRTGTHLRLHDLHVRVFAFPLA